MNTFAQRVLRERSDFIRSVLLRFLAQGVLLTLAVSTPARAALYHEDFNAGAGQWQLGPGWFIQTSPVAPTVLMVDTQGDTFAWWTTVTLGSSWVLETELNFEDLYNDGSWTGTIGLALGNNANHLLILSDQILSRDLWVHPGVVYWTGSWNAVLGGTWYDNAARRLRLRLERKPGENHLHLVVTAASGFYREFVSQPIPDSIWSQISRVGLRGFRSRIAFSHVTVQTPLPPDDPDPGDPPIDLNNGLLLHLPFDGDARDLTGRNPDAAVLGATPVPDRFGRADRAYRFTGTNLGWNDYPLQTWGQNGITNATTQAQVIVAEVADLPVGDAPRTLTAWVRPEDVRVQPGVIHYGQGDCTGKMFGIGLNWDVPGLYIWGGCSDVATWSQLLRNRWSFLAITYTHRQATAWVNGRATHFVMPHFQTEDSGTLWIGAETINGGLTFRQRFQGSIDDVRLYNRALSPGEIQALYQFTPPAVEFITHPNDQLAQAGDHVEFSVEVSATAPVQYQWQFNGVDIADESGPTLSLPHLDPLDAGSYQVIAITSEGQATSEAAVLTVLAKPLGDALDAPYLLWKTDGDVPWFPQETVSQDGVSAAESGTLTDGQTSSLQTVVTGPAQIRFWWRADSDSQLAALRFLVNGEERARITGTTDWTETAVDLAEGIHALRWDYAVEASDNGGAHRAWLDQVQYLPVDDLDPLAVLAMSPHLRFGQTRLEYAAPTDTDWILQSSHDLIEWKDVGPVNSGSGSQSLRGLPADTAPIFYRLRSL